MATTSPDNLYSPNSNDPYALVQDLGAMQSSVQNALIERANAYRGTSAQRNAFTTAPVGTIWSDTNGDRNVWKRGTSGWEELVPLEDTGWLNVPLASGWSGEIKVRLKNGWVDVYASLTNSSFSGSYTTIGNLPNNIPAPAQTRTQTYIQGTSSGIAANFRVNDSGALTFRRGETTGLGYPFTLTYSV